MMNGKDENAGKQNIPTEFIQKKPVNGVHYAFHFI